jgi:hypothetical protein
VIVPYIKDDASSSRVTVITGTAAQCGCRAVADAMPILQKGRESVESSSSSGAWKVQGTAGRGIPSSGAPRAPGQLAGLVADDIDVPNTILSHAADVGTDFS